MEPNFADAVRNSARELGQSYAEFTRRALEQRITAARGGARTSPRPPYDFSAAVGNCFVRDLATANEYPDIEAGKEAKDRLKALASWSQDDAAQFAVVNTTTGSSVIPPGYVAPSRDLTHTVDRPLFAAAEHGSIASATPFTAPANIPATGTADHVEGVGPPAEGGTLVITPVTVTPQAISGRMVLTRQIVDAASPAADRVALDAMREDFARRVETKIFELLNSSAGQAGTITGGVVPSGAAVRTSTGAALGTADLEKALLAYPGYRGRAPRNVIASARLSVAEALAGVDLDRLPFRGPEVALSPAITGTAAGDGDVFILSAGDLWCWSSPVGQFVYEERSGPQLIELALFGYVGTALLRPAGLSAIRHT